MEFPLNFKPTTFSVGTPAFSSYWNPDSSTNFTIAGTPAGSFADSGAAFQNYLNSNISPPSAFGNSGDSFGNILGTGTDPYSGMQSALQGIEDPTLRGLAAFNLEQTKFFNNSQNLKEQLKTIGEFRKEEAKEAAKLQALMSVPKIISNAGKDIAMAIANPARLKILADIPANIAPILQQGTASAGQILASSNAGISDMRFFR